MLNLYFYRKLYKKTTILIKSISKKTWWKKLGEVKCPECDADLEIPTDVISGEILSCPDCGMDYELILTGDDVTLTPAEIEGEDWGE